MSSPLVSICVPNLNKRLFLEERMETLLGQTFTDWEMIVCDSFSDDGSWEFFQKFKGDKRIRLHQVPREGIYAGWNECLRRAVAEYVYIATSDDTAQPGLLEKLLAPLEQHPEIHIGVCNYQPIDQQSKPWEERYPKQRRELLLGKWNDIASIRNGKSEFLCHACVGTIWHSMANVLFRRNLLEQVGYFRRDRGVAADLEWSMRASLASDVAYLPERLATFRIYAAQATPASLKTQGHHSTLLAMVEAVIEDPNSGIPSEWKTVPGWDRRITSVRRAEYLDGYGLYRGIARRDPALFRRNVRAAMAQEPAFLLRQAIRGFSWSDEFSPHKERTALDLMKLFHSPWPPQPLHIQR